MTHDPRSRLIALLVRLAPDLAAQLWSARDVAAVPRDVREAAVDVIGRECAARGLDEDDELNAYGEELESLVDALGLDEDSTAS